MLKADFHIHTKEDPKDHYKIKYTACQLIDSASEKGFEVLSITLHDKLLFNKRLSDYARKKNILLIPGVEMRIEGQDFLILMKKTIADVEEIKTYEALEDFRKEHEKNIIIIVPHLFYPRFFRGGIIKYGVADVFEFSHFYLRFFNPNKKAIELAKSLGKPMVGNSDAHALWQMDHTYSVLDCKKNVDSVFAAIRKGEVSVITRPYFFRTFILNIFDPGTYF